MSSKIFGINHNQMFIIVLIAMYSFNIVGFQDTVKNLLPFLDTNKTRDLSNDLFASYNFDGNIEDQIGDSDLIISGNLNITGKISSIPSLIFGSGEGDESGEIYYDGTYMTIESDKLLINADVIINGSLSTQNTYTQDYSIGTVSETSLGNLLDI